VIEAVACAKVNLSLRVASKRPDGLHPLNGLFQSILWMDGLELKDAAEDALQSPRGAEVIDGWHNLAWRAVSEVRDRAGSKAPVSLTLRKRIPVAAGLAGGSSDAAAGLAAAGARFGLDMAELATLAPALGSDVPFCFTGGLAEVGGVGEQIRVRPSADGFALVLVVPPAAVTTESAYRRWDELGEPSGFVVAGADLPPPLRDAGPLVNDLYPAAVSLEPAIEEWRSELVARWSRPVMLTGSGPTLFSFFSDREEALAAALVAPPGARAVTAAVPTAFGWAARVDTGPWFGRGGALETAAAGDIDATMAADPVSGYEAPTIDDPSD